MKRLVTPLVRLFTPHLYLMISLSALLTSCATSNKEHWNHVHPKGGWAGKNYIANNLTVNK